MWARSLPRLVVSLFPRSSWVCFFTVVFCDTIVVAMRSSAS